ncbi:hypothetical protein PR001_g19102 [Phytophthora rubi]|uniref:Uncharacterized protein n=1 Tax=Phytophthora rubi TaxID=129364 RepID=A0A6A3K125_9STRA|nr:hypothetical protein PR001_g19102 [Phytophthora rubi]
MEGQPDIKIDGVTAFALPLAMSYRYAIELKSSKMSIWMEDRISKKQWYKGGMAKTDYVSDANVIPDATVADYVKCFQDALDSDLGDCSDVQRKLYALDGGALRLEFAVKIRVFRSTWEAKYTFDLHPVSVERIDILESKLRDQQGEIQKLFTMISWIESRMNSETKRKNSVSVERIVVLESKLRDQHDELEQLRGEIGLTWEDKPYLERDGLSPSFVHLQTSRRNSESTMKWGPTTGADFASTGVDGVVKARRGGTYIIFVTVTTVPGANTPVYLLKNNTSIQVAYPGYSQGNIGSTSLSTIEVLENNNEITVKCSCKLVDTSYLCIARVGN